MFDPVARISIEREQLTKQTELLYSSVGPIEEGVYSHYEYADSSDGRDWFDLFYRVRYGGGDFSTGTLTITVFDDSERYGIAGFFLEAD